MRSVDAHLAALLELVEPLAPFSLGLLDARGCRLAEDVTARWSLPAFDSAECDGYAVSIRDVYGASAETPVRLRIVDEVRPGARPRAAVVSGGAVRVRAGAAIPEGTEAVVPLRSVIDDADWVDVMRAVELGANIRRTGAEVAAGEVIVRHGEVIDARSIALLASTGVGAVHACPPPRVVIVTVGDELIDPGATMLPGAVVDSNGAMLAALVQELGAVAYRVGPLPDDEAHLERAVADQLVRADLILIAGGTSTSAYETITRVVERLGQMQLHRVAIEPGGGQGVGLIGDDDVPVLTLPGHPASAFVSFEVFVRPVILRMAGAERVHRQALRAELLEPLTSTSGVRQYVPSHRGIGTDGVLRVRPLHSQHVTSELAEADCLIVIPDAVEQLVRGDVVDVLPIDGAR